jgi:SUMO ligase MMS21 Smc5/6 complex component
LNEFGSFNEVFKKIVEKEVIKLIIMETHGETDDENIILGRNAVNVIEKVRNCPVLTIPGNIVFKKPNEIVFPTSYKTHYKESELATLIEISKLTKAPIRILHMQSDKELSKKQEEKKSCLIKF